ncbi:MAG: cupin domain-containing protein [Comamonadaceae bacterium]|nr:cupin domain-containing protein [Comamonadaceae bacterium]
MQGVAGYSPANHTGTSNQRLISRDTVGAKYIEVLIGTIVKGHGASRHFHPGLEQAGFMFQGSGISEIDGVVQEAGPGSWRHYRKGVPHRITVTSDEPVKTIVVYAPPYAESRDAVVVCEDDTSPGYAANSTEGEGRPLTERPRLDSCVDQGVQYVPIINAELSGAEHMEVFGVSLSGGGGVVSPALHGLEQVLFVRTGVLSGQINGDTFNAVPGDFIFIPDGAEHAYSASEGSKAEAFLIRAFS